MSNPLSDILGQIDREKQVADALARVEDARFRAVGDRNRARAFYTKLAIDLKPVVDWDCGTAYTDGAVVAVNPAFILSLPPEQVHGVVLGHETLHCAQMHFSRGRTFWVEDQETANIAADLEINPMCEEAGYQLPASALFPGRGVYRDLPVGLTFEEYYRLLKQKKQGQPVDKKSGGGGNGGSPDNQPGDKPGKPGDDATKPGEGKGNDPGGCGGFRPAPDEATAKAKEAEWQGKVAAAAQSVRGKGDLPAYLTQYLASILKPKRDPWGLLQDYLTRLAHCDQSWCKPNRRLLSQGIHIPGKAGYALGDLALLVDCSGSIGQDDMRRMAGLMESLLGLHPGKLTLIYHTTGVTHVDEWTPNDGELEIVRHGSGGTSHVAAFAEILDRDINPAVIVALTDLETDFPQDPGVPTLWVDVSRNGREPPFGKVVCVAEE